jgi:hypothetical protein
MEIKNKGYVVPVAIGILVIASLGLLVLSWFGGAQKTQPTVTVPSESNNDGVKQPLANDDATLAADSANIDAQLKTLDSNNADVNSGLNDTSSI